MDNGVGAWKRIWIVGLGMDEEIVKGYKEVGEVGIWGVR